jgi:hypothetical protein
VIVHECLSPTRFKNITIKHKCEKYLRLDINNVLHCFFLLLREEHNTLSSFAGQRIVKIDIKLKELLANSQILLI